MLKVSNSPHIKAKNTTFSIMLDVIIALTPCVIAGMHFFGTHAGLLIAVSLISSYTFEYLWCLLLKKPNTANDLSCVVSGIILALNLPPTAPLWIPIVGSLFMIIIVKMLFGGIGQNFMNPAGAARLFLVYSFPIFMGRYIMPLGFDAITTATPLALAKMGEYTDLLQMFIGNISGCIGETSSLAILIGFVYLLFRKIIKFDIPVIYVGVVAVLTAVIGKPVFFYMLSGGLLFGAVFMATDYSSSPITRTGRIIYAVLLGVMTFTLRFYSSFPEGVVMSIVFMNCLAPLIDKWVKPRRFGT